MKIKILCAFLLFRFLLEAAPPQSLFDAIYELTSSDGRKLRAKILNFKVDSVSVEVEANKTVYEIPYSRFDQLTQTQLHQLWAMEMHKKMGISIIPQDSGTLWDIDILEFAKKFNIKRKLHIPNSADYYYLTEYKDAILGARAYRLRVYPNNMGNKTKIKRVEIEFANVKAYPLSPEKIDNSSIFVIKEGGSQALDAAMLADKKVIKSQLDSCFGEGVDSVIGESAVTRWDSKGYSFLLELKIDDALILQIVPTDSLPILDKNASE